MGTSIEKTLFSHCVVSSFAIISINDLVENCQPLAIDFVKTSASEADTRLRSVSLALTRIKCSKQKAESRTFNLMIFSVC